MKLKTLVLAAACLATGSLVLAQTVPAAKPAKAATKAAAPAASGGKIGGSGKGPILTRDELRACLTQEEGVRKRLETLDARRAVLAKDKADIATDQQTLRGERGPVDEARKQVEDLSARMKAYGVRVESWNTRVAAFNGSSPSGTKADRERDELNKEREELAKQQKDLEAEKARLNASSTATVDAYNTKATAIDARVGTWNQANDQLNTESRAAETERSAWVAACSDRRYREEDETAIRQGK